MTERSYGRSRSLLLIALVLALPSGVWAQAPAPPTRCAGLALPADATIDDLVRSCLEANETSARKGEAMTKEAKKQLAVEPGGAATSPTFADRVSESLTNFLPIFSGVIDGVTTGDEGKSLVVRLNAPWRILPFLEAGLSVTLREPELAEDVTTVATESAAQDGLKKTLGDLDDPTYQLLLNLVRGAGTTSDGRVWMVGRNPELYQRYYTRLVAEAIEESVGGQRNDGLSYQLSAAMVATEDSRSLDELKVSEIQGFMPAWTDGHIRALVAEEVEVVERLDPLSTDLAKSFKKLNDLVDKQPQVVLTAALRDPDELIGPEERSFGLVIEASNGPNLNSILRAGGTISAASLSAMAPPGKMASWSFSLKASWTEKRAGTFERQIPDSDTPLEIEREESETIQASVLASREILSHPVTIDGKEVFPKLLFSLERLDEDDPARNDRTIARLTYDFPISKGLNLPLSVVWANHGEFLPETDERLSAHVGFSYALPKVGGK